MQNLFFLFLFALSAQAQQGADVERYFIEILKTKNSREIIYSHAYKSLQKQYGNKALVYLAKFFDDPKTSKIYSDCHTRYLTKGEAAIIVADKIKAMPYFSLTGLQNCTLSYCKDNPNRVEFYFPYIKSYTDFQRKYYQYLLNENR